MSIARINRRRKSRARRRLARWWRSTGYVSRASRLFEDSLEGLFWPSNPHPPQWVNSAMGLHADRFEGKHGTCISLMDDPCGDPALASAEVAKFERWITEISAQRRVESDYQIARGQAALLAGDAETAEEAGGIAAVNLAVAEILSAIPAPEEGS